MRWLVVLWSLLVSPEVYTSQVQPSFDMEILARIVAVHLNSSVLESTGVEWALDHRLKPSRQSSTQKRDVLVKVEFVKSLHGGERKYEDSLQHRDLYALVPKSVAKTGKQIQLLVSQHASAELEGKRVKKVRQAGLKRMTYYLSPVDKVRELFEAKWDELISPHLQHPGIFWEFRVSDPFPVKWPASSPELIFYSYARGRDLSLHDAEREGPVWATVKMSETPFFALVTSEVEVIGSQGFRPLSSEELKILGAEPVELLSTELTPETTKQLKAYYCLQKSLGNIPALAMTKHPEFFQFLGCK